MSADGYLVTADGEAVGWAASRALAEALAVALRAVPSLLPSAHEGPRPIAPSFSDVQRTVSLYKPHVPTSPAEVAAHLRALGIRCAYQHSHGCIYGAMGDRQFAVGTADGDWWGVTVRDEIGGTDDPMFDATVAPEGAPATLIAVAVATALLSFDKAARGHLGHARPVLAAVQHTRSGEIAMSGHRCTFRVRRVPLPAGSHHPGRPLVPAVRAVLP